MRMFSQKLEKTLARMRGEVVEPLSPTPKPAPITMKNKKFSDADLQAYIDYISADYEKWTSHTPNDESKFTVSFEPGSKYLRVVTTSWGSRSAHTFIDVDGNIWKSASWKSPAKNFTRGNIIARDFSKIRWTGAV